MTPKLTKSGKPARRPGPRALDSPVQFNVQVPETLAEQVRRLSAEQDRSMSSFTRVALQEYIKGLAA